MTAAMPMSAPPPRRLAALALVAPLLVLLAACAREEPYLNYLAACAPPSPGDVSVTWMGVAGIHVADGESGFLVDPFVSQGNASLATVVSGAPLHSDPWSVARWSRRLSPATAIFVTHSHYDHVLDVPAFAERLSAKVLGGTTTGLVMEGHGLARLFELVEPGESRTVGGFEVDLIASLHGTGLPMGVPAPGDAKAPIKPGSAALAYKVGQVFALRIRHPQGTLFYLGSGGSVEKLFEGVEGPAAALMTLSARSPTQAYIAHVVGQSGAGKVIPIHFDDLFRPPTAPPRVQTIAMLDDFGDELARQAPDVLFAPQPVGEPCAAFATP
ncbi:MAG: MBL fold metallo-hydrolase [Pseudomonadota bacterium]